MNVTDSISYSFNNYSLIENAFVDDSADISSDETLFSITPSGFDNDSENQTPLPTINTPFDEMKFSTPTIISDKLTNERRRTSLGRLSDIKPADLEIDDDDNEDDSKNATPKNEPIIQVVHQENNPFMNFNQELKSILKHETDEKSEITKTVTLANESFKTETKKTSDKPCNCTFIRFEKNPNPMINPLQDASYVNKNSINILNEHASSTKSIDMKSQMVKYNEYLFYLKHGFPRKYS